MHISGTLRDGFGGQWAAGCVLCLLLGLFIIPTYESNKYHPLAQTNLEGLRDVLLTLGAIS